MSRAEPYRREVRSGSGSAGSVRAPVSTTSSPSGASTVGRCSRELRLELGPRLVRRVDEDEVVRRATRAASAQTASPQATRAPVRRSFSRFSAIVRQAARSLSTKVDARGAARERLEPHRARAGEEVEHGGAVDRPDQVEGGLADAVAGRPGREPLRRGDPRPAVRAGDDSHAGAEYHTRGARLPGNRGRAEIEIRRLSGAELREQLDALAAVLHDCVAGGASVGYMAPFSHEDALSAFEGFAADAEQGRRLILAAFVARRARRHGAGDPRADAEPAAPRRDREGARPPLRARPRDRPAADGARRGRGAGRGEDAARARRRHRRRRRAAVRPARAGRRSASSRTSRSTRTDGRATRPTSGRRSSRRSAATGPPARGRAGRA